MKSYEDSYSAGFLVRNRVMWRPRLKVVAAVYALLAAANLCAQQSRPSEYQVKAVYLYNFGRFISWPANSKGAKGESFTFCVLGRDPFGPSLDATLAGQTINGKDTAVKRVSKPEDALGCRILFISSSEKKGLKDILSALDQANVLTVSDIPDFSRRGGMIQFVLEGDKVRFEVNLTAAENAGLVLSSELLKVASAVRRNAHAGD